MKKTLIILITFFISSLLISFKKTKLEKEYIYITGSRFTYPLIEKWIVEYQKIYTNSNIRLIKRGLNLNIDSVNLTIISRKLTPEDLGEKNEAIQVAQYAILPIVNSKNQTLLKKINNVLREKELKELFFNPNQNEFEVEVQEINKKTKFINQFNVYTRLTKSDASISFADHYGSEQKFIKGKQISGDDQHLIQALINDTAGLSYNNLGFIYDLNTRQNVVGISVIPIDLNNNKYFDIEEKKIYSSLDNVVEYLEQNETSKIPTENVNLVFEKDTKNKELKSFLNWILTEGQKYNHQYGFLSQNKKKITKQIEIINNL